jgi:pantetheine-phosphate adenylyltransferase
MIENGSRLFDQLTVAIGINPEKKYRFTLAQRMRLLRESTAHLRNVHIADFENLFLVHYARQIGAGFILRGVRNEADYGYERGMRYVNGEFDSSITSVFLMPPREYAEISSSFVKGLVGPAGWEGLLSKYVPPCVYRAFIKSGGLEDALTPLPISQLVDQLRPLLETHYREAHRHYHTLEHIANCLTHFESVRDQFADPEAALLAIWFHDAIYDPTRRDNEEASAELAASELRARHLPDATIEKVRRLILATRHDQLAADADAALLADIDLSILGAAEADFDQYEQAIRLEYVHVSDEPFRAGRAAFLETLLERPTIYLTQTFASQWEKAARANLARSIRQLRSEAR